MRNSFFYVYLLASKRHGTLYLGVTNNLRRRLEEHRSGAVPGFTRHAVHQLVWFELHDSLEHARQREKTLKKWKRAWKVALIEEGNPDWRDLSDTLEPLL